MAWIRSVNFEESEGSLRRQYDQALKRAGKIFNILKIQSLNPSSLQASIQMYTSLMLRPSGLSREEREMIAVVVSAANNCHY